MNDKYNWDWMREYYMRSQENSRTRLKDVATLFDVPYQTVRRKAGQENWVGNAAVFSDKISYFKDQKIQKRYLELAVPLAKKDYRDIDVMIEFEPGD